MSRVTSWDPGRGEHERSRSLANGIVITVRCSFDLTDAAWQRALDWGEAETTLALLAGTLNPMDRFQTYRILTEEDIKP